MVPQLDLPKSERYAVAAHGSTRPISGLLLNAICDTLIKFAVRGPSVPGLSAMHIDRRVDMLVRELLRGADVTRWLSLSGELPALAELGSTYRANAKALEITHPRFSALLERLAQSCERDDSRENLNSRLWSESLW